MSDRTALGDKLHDQRVLAVAHFEAGGTVLEFASKSGIGLSTVYGWHAKWRKFGPEHLIRVGRHEIHEFTPLDVREREVLDGLMLGDGCLFMGARARNPCLHITRSGADLEYLTWTAGIFNRRLTDASLRVHEVRDPRTHKTYQSARLRTRCDAALLPEYGRWYPGGKKAVPSDLVLSRTAIAIWLADDGYIKAASRRCPEIRFATHGFDKREVQQLAGLLAARYEDRFAVNEESKAGQFTIRAYGSAGRKLLRDVDAAFPPLDRKSKLWRCTELLEERVPPPPCPRCDCRHVVYWSRTSKGIRTFKCQGCMRVFREVYQHPSRMPRRDARDVVT